MNSITILLEQKLVAEQFAQWKDLLITPVAKGGADNITFSLGDKMLLRFPSAKKIAWTLFKGESRQIFISMLSHIDQDTWNRARGWTL